jgi:hypothetical protein
MLLPVCRASACSTLKLRIFDQLLVVLWITEMKTLRYKVAQMPIVHIAFAFCIVVGKFFCHFFISKTRYRQSCLSRWAKPLGFSAAA